MSVSAKFKTNHDMLATQQKEFAKGGVLLKKIFGVSPEHPILSVIFALAFGVLVNAIYDLASYLVISEDFSSGSFLNYVLLVALFGLVCCWVIARLKSLHPGLFVDTPLSQKKVLVTLVSKGRTDYKDTPSYNTFQSLLYNPGGQAATNALEKVVLVTTELPEVTVTANDLKTFIDSGGRTGELYGITINNKSLLEIQAQMILMLNKLRGTYPAHEIIVDYTGGTKDMSIALLRASEKGLITPVYLNSATDGNHTKY